MVNAINEDDAAQNLLKVKCSLWLSIRGHPLTREWMESYKLFKKKGTRRSKALHTDLKEEEDKKAEEKRENKLETSQQGLDTETAVENPRWIGRRMKWKRIRKEWRCWGHGGRNRKRCRLRESILYIVNNNEWTWLLPRHVHVQQGLRDWSWYVG